MVVSKSNPVSDFELDRCRIHIYVIDSSYGMDKSCCSAGVCAHACLLFDHALLSAHTLTSNEASLPAL